MEKSKYFRPCKNISLDMVKTDPSQSPYEKLKEELNSSCPKSFVEKKDEKSQSMGDWSEHVSSSGKIYYYNYVTEVSQWEKPKDWIDQGKKKGREKETYITRVVTSQPINCPRVVEQSSQTPPTPTQEEQEGTKSDFQQPILLNSDIQVSSISSATLIPANSLYSSLKSQIPSITPSLANYHREELIGHIIGWPSHAHRCMEESYIMSSIQCTKVSAELKMARALVRLSEIQATLQEQRILFYRQHVQELEEKSPKSKTTHLLDS